MSFSKAKRFVYSPPLSQSRDASSSDDQKVDKDVTYNCSDGQSNKKLTDTCSAVQCTGCIKIRTCANRNKYSKIRPKQSTFIKNLSPQRNLFVIENNQTPSQFNRKSDQNISLENSFSSCSSNDTIFHDTLPYACFNIDRVEAVEDIDIRYNVNDKRENVTDHINSNKGICKKYIADVKQANKSVMSIQELQYKTANSIRNETTKKIKVFLEDINKIHATFLDKMNRQCLKIVTDLNTGFGQSDRISEERLKHENQYLKSIIKKLTMQLQKNKQKLKEMSIYYRDLLDRAEKKIHDHENTVETLKEELSAANLKERLQCILKIQDK